MINGIDVKSALAIRIFLVSSMSRRRVEPCALSPISASKGARQLVKRQTE